VYGYLYLLFTTYPRVFGQVYHFSEGGIALVYLGSGVGTLIGMFICGILLDRVLNWLTKRNGGKPKPEYRLPTMLVGSILIPAGLFIYAWTANEHIHWMAPIVGTAIIGGAMMIIFVSYSFEFSRAQRTNKWKMPGLTYLVDSYTVYAASVSAAATVFRSLLGALLPLAGNAMYNSLGVDWGNSLLGFIAVACIPVPILFYYYGESLRNKSSHIKF